MHGCNTINASLCGTIPLYRYKLLTTLACLLPFFGVADETGTQDGWRRTVQLQFADALREFRGDVKTRGAQAALGEAISLLNRQPRTQRNLEVAREILGELKKSEDADLAVAATYHLARYFHVVPYHRDPVTAEIHYRDLLDRHPHHFYGQLATSKLALLRLYETPVGEDRGKILEELELLAWPLRIPAAKRSYHKVMANGYLRFEVSREKALSHLLAAFDAGIVEDSSEAQSIVQIIELAVLLGKEVTARDFTGRFLAMYPRDQRARYLANRFNLALPPMR